jgi:hypothetical protein
MKNGYSAIGRWLLAIGMLKRLSANGPWLKAKSRVGAEKNRNVPAGRQERFCVIILMQRYGCMHNPQYRTNFISS